MKKKLCVLIIVGITFLCGCVEQRHRIHENMQDSTISLHREDKLSAHTIKIWLDKENGYIVRKRISDYEKNAGSYAQDGADTDIVWELIDKSYLTAAQYKNELNNALKAGEGPDLIYMDTGNGLEPEELMTSGALAKIPDISTLFGKEIEYLPNTIEAGMDKKCAYVLPVYVQCPVLFGQKEDLQEAGIQMQAPYDSLKTFLGELLKAQERTGKQVLENDSAFEWISSFYLPEDNKQSEELREMLAVLKTRCGAQDGTYAAYEGLSQKSCLLGGCGVTDYLQMAQNLSLFSKEDECVCISIPDYDGGTSAVITHAIGINAASKNISLARKALYAFQTPDISWNPDLPAAAGEAYWDSLLDMGYVTANGSEHPGYAERAEKITPETEKSFLEASQHAVTDAYYAKAEDKEQSGNPVQKEVMTLFYQETETDSSISRWLRSVVKQENTDNGKVMLQLLPVSGSGSTTSITYQEMDRHGMAADFSLYGSNEFRLPPGYKESDIPVTDLTDLYKKYADKLDFLPKGCQSGVDYMGKPVGLPVRALKYGMYCNREVLKKAGLSNNWIPTDMEELTAGLQKMKGVLKNGKAAGILTENDEELKALALFASENNMLEKQENGTWVQSRTAWETFVRQLTDWKEQQLVTECLSRGDGMTKKQTAQALADGTVGIVFEDARYADWYEGVGGIMLSEKQRENIRFVPLGNAVTVDMVVVSKRSEYAENMFQIWLDTVQDFNYEKVITESRYLPVTALSDTDIVIPTQRSRFRAEDFLGALSEENADAEALAEAYKWYDKIK